MTSESGRTEVHVDMERATGITRVRLVQDGLTLHDLRINREG